MARRERLGALLDDFDGAVVMISHDRHLLDATRRRRSPSSTAGRSGSGPAPTAPTSSPASSSSSASARSYVTQQKEIARLEDAVRRFRHWAHIRVNERAARQARVKQMQIDRMEKVERPVFERRRMALALRSGARGGQRVLALEGVDASYGDDPGPARRRPRRHARRARRRRRPQRRRQDDAAADPRRRARARGRHALGRRRDHGRLPVPGRGRAAATTRPCSTRCAPAARCPRTPPCGC